MNNQLVTINENKEITIDKKWIKQYREFKKLQLTMELAEKEFKEQLKEAMESIGKDSLIKDGFSAKIKAGYTTKRFDSARFKKECPDIYEQYTKESSVSSSISIEVE
jgi:predicted phage-related endonuclease